MLMIVAFSTLLTGLIVWITEQHDKLITSRIHWVASHPEAADDILTLDTIRQIYPFIDTKITIEQAKERKNAH